MTITLNSLSSVVSGTTLDSTFVNLINNIMKQETTPLNSLTDKRDSATTQKAVYTDLKSQLDNLKSASDALISTNVSYAMKMGRKASVSGIFDTKLNTTSSATVVNVSATSTAAVGTYNLANVVLAKAQTLISNPQMYGDQALGWSGSFTIGGLAARAAALDAGASTSTVASVATGALVSGQTELGSGPYKVEIRQDPNSTDGAWQFRLVDEDGQAVSIQNADKTGFNSSWQSIPTGDNLAYDTGRGLVINFNGDTSGYAAASSSSGAPQINYTAQGATIAIEKTDSLVKIANKINAAIYADGNGVSATVVDNRLVLTASRTGENHQIAYQDNDGGTILSGLGLTEKVQAKNGSFELNGLPVTRSRNTGLTNVIAGATIDLASDAENKTATINIAADNSAEKKAINSFITNFNSLTDYIKAKSAVTKQSDGTYKRSALASETVFTGLRNSLYSLVNGNAANSGTLKNLRDIGISLDDNLDLTISDSDKLEKALLNDPNNVQALLDKVMSGIDDKLNYYTGQKGYVSSEITSTDSEITAMNNRIDSMTDRLNKRQDNLVKQYAQLQSQLYLMQYTSQLLSSIYSVTSSA